MSDLSKIKNLNSGAVASLGAQNINTTDDLWLQVGRDFEGLADRSGVTLEILTSILIADSFDQVEMKGILVPKFATTHPRLYRGIKAAVVVVFLAVILSGLFFLFVYQRLPRQVVVKRNGGIAQYQIISADDVKTRRVMFNATQTFAEPINVVGCMALSPIAENAPVSSAVILPATTAKEITGHPIFSLSAKSEAIPSHIKPPSSVRLVASVQLSEKGPPTKAEIDVLLLGIERRGDDANIVFAVDKSKDISPFLQNGTVHVVRDAP